MGQIKKEFNRLTGILVTAVIVLLWQIPVTAASKLFLEVTDILGDVTEAGNDNQINAQSYSGGASRSATGQCDWAPG